MDSILLNVLTSETARDALSLEDVIQAAVVAAPWN